MTVEIHERLAKLETSQEYQTAMLIEIKESVDTISKINSKVQLNHSVRLAKIETQQKNIKSGLAICFTAIIGSVANFFINKK